MVEQKLISNMTPRAVVVSRADGGGEMLPFPKSKPPFTLGDLKRAIPPHCFKRSVLRSFSYLLRDVVFASIFFYIATNYLVNLPHPLPYLAWPIYWIFQGSTFFGAWVLGHDCGHNAFSHYKWLDDTVGFLLHSALLTPYFSLKISHSRHHSNTSSLDRDELYIPPPKSKNGSVTVKYLNNPLGRLFRVVIRIAFGWYLYVFFNLSGRKYDRYASHFHPHSPIYSESERILIVLSDVGILTTGYLLYCLAASKGLAWFVCVLGVPLLMVYGYLALTTYLHHTHVAVPHYDSSGWDWMRGALATIDRDYGILNWVFHDFTDTHVVHHLFPTIPHYHAMEATTAIKPILGEYYNYDGTPILQALWRESKECIYVEGDEGGIFWYSNKP